MKIINLILTLVALLTMLSYAVALVIKDKKIPYSISATYYSLIFSESFGGCMSIPALLIFPVTLSLSSSILQIVLSAFMSIGLICVGLFPDYAANKRNETLHISFAILTMVASQIWIALMSEWWLSAILFGLFIIYSAVYLRAKDDKRLIRVRPLFWVEVICISTLFYTILNNL